MVASMIKWIKMLFASAFVRRRAKILVALGIFLSGFLGFNYLVATRPDKPLQPRAEQVWTVQTAIVEFQTAYPQKSAFRAGNRRRANLVCNSTSPARWQRSPIFFKTARMCKKVLYWHGLDPTLLQIAHDEN